MIRAFLCRCQISFCWPFGHTKAQKKDQQLKSDSQPCELIYLNLNNQFISFHIGWSMSLWAQRVAQRIWRKTCKWYFSLSLGVKIADCVHLYFKPVFLSTMQRWLQYHQMQEVEDQPMLSLKAPLSKSFFEFLVFSHVKSSIWCDFHWKKVREN